MRGLETGAGVSRCKMGMLPSGASGHSWFNPWLITSDHQHKPTSGFLKTPQTSPMTRSLTSSPSSGTRKGMVFKKTDMGLQVQGRSPTVSRSSEQIPLLAFSIAQALDTQVHEMGRPSGCSECLPGLQLMEQPLPTPSFVPLTLTSYLLSSLYDKANA